MALNIQSLNVSAINSQSINVNLISYNATSALYKDYNMSIVNTVITLNVCYHYIPFNSVSILTNNFQIALPSAMSDNYTLIVNLFFDNLITTVCDYQILSDTATLTFATPLTNPVFLASNTFEANNSEIDLFPNPSIGFLAFSNEKMTPKAIFIYDNLGRLIKQIPINVNKTIDISNMLDGFYFLKFESESGSCTKKIILKK
jgi:hypothetical protein